MPGKGEGNSGEVRPHADMSDAHGRLSSCGADEELIALATDCLAPDAADRPAHAGRVAERVSAWLTSVAERAQRSRIRAAEAEVRAKAERRARSRSSPRPPSSSLSPLERSATSRSKRNDPGGGD